MKFFLVLLMLLMAVFESFGSDLRIWTSRSGKTMEASYEGAAGDKVVLRTAGGVKKRIPISGLCEKDQALIYNMKPPSLEMEVSRGMRRDSVQGDIDDKTEDFKFEVVITEKKTRPYTKEITLELFVIGKDLYAGTYKLIDKKVENFKLRGKSGTVHTFHGKNIRIQHDPDPGWGIKLESYIAIISLSDGTVLETKGKGGYSDNLPDFRKANVGSLFSSRMRPIKN